jgi:hypothetical protein
MIPLAVSLRLVVVKIVIVAVVVEIVVDAVVVVIIRIGVENNSWRGITLIYNKFNIGRKYK